MSAAPSRHGGRTSIHMRWERNTGRTWEWDRDSEEQRRGSCLKGMEEWQRKKIRGRASKRRKRRIQECKCGTEKMKWMIKPHQIWRIMQVTNAEQEEVLRWAKSLVSFHYNIRIWVVACHNGMARPQVTDRTDGLQMLTVVANILNEQNWRGPPTWGLGVGIIVSHRNKTVCYELRRIPCNDISKGKLIWCLTRGM
jgi:hypothetical protein